MPSADDDDIVELIPAAKAEPGPYVDYDGQVERLPRYGSMRLGVREAAFFCAFGYAGTGKSGVGKPVALSFAAAGEPFSLLKVNGLSFPQMSVTRLRDTLDGIDRLPQG